MAVLIVGADRLGKIQEKITLDNEIIHWSGRSKNCNKKSIPKRVTQIIIFCDFVNHLLMYSIKKQARKEGVPVIYSKRALSHNLGKLLA
ncbi:MAG TPA: DUF2325 domain-containing protein [Bacillota bacterium]|jgi:hypothetical protein|nr:DUF2325 domain-containing protein [Bacillota bacterium]HOL08638.1 DUF2325 domain-containing protein [Bacillota bacterium]HPO96660.1 DUF2325 domain-containing protein [Bacillota bacterium]